MFILVLYFWCSGQPMGSGVVRQLLFLAPPPTYHLTEELLRGRINREIQAASSNNLVFREAFDTVIYCSHRTVVLHLFADVFNLT